MIHIFTDPKLDLENIKLWKIKNWLPKPDWIVSCHEYNNVSQFLMQTSRLMCEKRIWFDKRIQSDFLFSSKFYQNHQNLM